jgi:hypothetical protein
VASPGNASPSVLISKKEFPMHTPYTGPGRRIGEERWRAAFKAVAERRKQQRKEELEHQISVLGPFLWGFIGGAITVGLAYALAF